MEKLSLHGNWNLSGSHEGKAIFCSAQIPGDFHTALLNADLIQDPYYSKNETSIQWIAREDWTIERTFAFHKEKAAHTYIVLTDADTFFTIFINGNKAGSGENMFRRYRFDITKFLIEGENTIRIVFASAEKEAAAEAKKLPYPIPSSSYPVFSPNRNLIRKVQCHAGWDWGPCLMVSGIYGVIELQTTSEGWFESVTVETRPKKNTNTWTVHATAVYEAIHNDSKNFVFSLTGSGIKNIHIPVPVTTVKGQNRITAEFDVTPSELWKTADELRESGLTENSLYELSVATIEESSADDDEITKKIAFKTLHIVNKKDNVDGKPGLSMYFELNGRPLFAKGADWIPCDALPSRQTPEKYRYLLNSMVEANMNIVRLWGGGQYEKDIFYDLCDQLGIMIWHDCMFACSMYPSTPDFLANVKAELDYQIPRLQTHPSIALWCGNNENIGAMTWYEESKKNPARYIIDYDRLNSGIVEKAVKEYDPERTWWPSSPCAGTNDFSDNWLNDNAGDMHFWSVWHGKQSFDAYLSIKPRFVSEFGYESFPSLEGVKSYTPENQFNLTSPVMEYHQRSAGGNSIILENFSRYFRFPTGFENMLYLSQVQQAVAIKTAVEYWRSLKPHCMGAIFWQLNDVWPVASWSSIEYSGKWKLLQYAAKDFFAPVLISLYRKDNEIFATVCNDTLSELSVSVTIHILRFDGKSTIKPFTIQANVLADGVKQLWNSKITDLPYPANECFIYAELTGSAAGKQTTEPYKSVNTLFPALYKDCELPKSHITYEVQAANNKDVKQEYSIILKADQPTFFLSLECEGISGRFNKNMLTLLPDKKVTVVFKPDSDTFSAENVLKTLRIRSLRDTY